MDVSYRRASLDTGKSTKYSGVAIRIVRNIKCITSIVNYKNIRFRNSIVVFAVATSINAAKMVFPYFSVTDGIVRIVESEVSYNIHGTENIVWSNPSSLLKLEIFSYSHELDVIIVELDWTLFASKFDIFPRLKMTKVRVVNFALKVYIILTTNGLNMT
eukprot:186408_1